LRRREQNGIVERAVADWLTRATERSYQLPFAQVLMSKGYAVIQISTHGPLEQGKDLVAKDNRGRFHAYQMKCGNINLKVWHEIRGEVDDLIRLPIANPSVPKKSHYTSYLVTNGHVSEEVRRQIDETNQDNDLKGRGYSFLKLIELDELKKLFTDTAKHLWPSELADTRQFLNLLASDGCDFFPKEAFSDFLETWMFRAKSPSVARNLISASIVVAAQLLQPFESVENWFAVSEGWTCLSAAILRLAARHEIRPAEWEQSFKLTSAASMNALQSLKEECLSRQDLLEGPLIGDGGYLYRARTVLVMGALSALELSGVRSGRAEEFDVRLKNWILGNTAHLWYWGESAFPCYLNIIRYLEAVAEKDLAREILESTLKRTLTCNAADSPGGIPDPYVQVSEVVSGTILAEDNLLDLRQFTASAYELESLVQMAVRRGYRDLLESCWYSISKIQYAEFVPDEPSDYFAWHSAKGRNLSRFSKPTQSYHELELQSVPSASCAIPFLEIARTVFPFWLMVCPHRASPPLVAIVDDSRPVVAAR
jgi:hypothetical protein